MPKAVHFTKGSIIYFEGDKDDRIFILQEGLVILTSMDLASRTPVTENIHKGEFFGVKSALGHFPREETATVLSQATAIVLTISEFEQVLGGNRQLILKMLRVFSNQLRTIHKQIEQMLNTNKEPVNQESGLLSVAQTFFADNDFQPCCDICIKFLTKYPNSARKGEAAKLYTSAKARLDREAQNNQSKEPIFVDDGGVKPLEIFSLPSFSRFAKTFKHGSVIIAEFESGESFYLIQSGLVQLVKCVNGVKKNLDMLHPGEFFGEMAILDNTPRSATCIAYNNVTVLEFNKENFAQLITGNPQIALILLKLFCKRIYDQRRRFRILVMPDAQSRIADVFLMFNEMNGSSNYMERKRTFNITVQDIVNWTALPLEQVQDELNRMSEKGRIEMFTDRITVSNIADMERVVENSLQIS